jgi:hypothetical protein
MRPLILLACFLPGPAAPAAAQAVMLDLGAQTVVFAPQAELDLPLTLNAPGEGPTEILMDVGFPADFLAFVSAEAGSSVEIAGGRLRAELKQAAAGETDSVIAIEVKSPKALATGTLVTFKLRLGPKAEPGSEIRVRSLKRAVTAAGGKPMQAQGADGLVTVIEPLPPCFFYMH